jgi:hypothetical protein
VLSTSNLIYHIKKSEKCLFPLIFSSILIYTFSSARYDALSDGLEDVYVDNKMNTQITLEDEDALDPIDDI